ARGALPTVEAQVAHPQRVGAEIVLLAQAEVVVLAGRGTFATRAAPGQPLKMDIAFPFDAASRLLPEERPRRFGGADVHPPAIALGATCRKGELLEGRAQHRRPVRLHADITQLGQARP